MRFAAAALAALILLTASSPVLAKKNPPRPFQLREDVLLNGAQVPAGLYDLIWETQGGTARVTLQKDGKFVATAEGAYVNSGIKYIQDAAVLRENPDGSESLIEIRIAGSAKAIVLKTGSEVVHFSATRHTAAPMP